MNIYFFLIKYKTFFHFCLIKKFFCLYVIFPQFFSSLSFFFNYLICLPKKSELIGWFCLSLVQLNHCQKISILHPAITIRAKDGDILRIVLGLLSFRFEFGPNFSPRCLCVHTIQCDQSAGNSICPSARTSLRPKYHMCLS